MKITLIVVLVLGLLLVFTNPEESSHKEAITQKMLAAMREKSSGSDNKWEELGAKMAEGFIEKLIDEAVTRDNFLLFSMGKISYQGEEKYITVGLFGNVILLEDPGDNI